MISGSTDYNGKPYRVLIFTDGVLVYDHSKLKSRKVRKDATVLIDNILGTMRIGKNPWVIDNGDKMKVEVAKIENMFAPKWWEFWKIKAGESVKR